MRRKILVFLDNFDTGGVTSVVRNIYRNIDQTRFEMDFARRNSNLGDFDAEVTKKGNTVYYYSDCGLSKIPVWNYKRRQLYIAKQVISQVRREKKYYDVIHVHANPIIGLYIGMRLNIPIRIMHVHEAVPDFGDNIAKSRIMAYLWKYRKRKYNEWATIKAGDSLKACCVKYGNDVVNDKKMKVLYPPVDMLRFNPEQYSSEDVVEYGVDQQVFNMIHVGRLCAAKNQLFILDILKEMNQRCPAYLYLVGEGPLLESIRNYAKELDVLDRVIFLPGNTTPGLYKLMNCSLLPSLSEAFGMVAVESQLMGVPCFASTNVPEDVDVGMCSFLPLEDGTSKWVDAILGYDYDTCDINSEKLKKFRSEELINSISELYEKKA